MSKWNGNSWKRTRSEKIDTPAMNCGKHAAKRIGTEVFILAAGIFFFALPAHALADQDSIVHTAPPSQTAPMNPSGDAAESRARVVRLSHVEGTVQILRGGETEFSHAVMNMPLLEGTRISTGADGRAEIEFEDGSVARLTPNSALDLSKFDAGAENTLDTSVQQVSGLVYYELRSDPTTQFHVMAGGRTVTPVANSTFRINLGASPGDVAVIAGAIQVRNGADGATEVRQGKTAQFQAAGSGEFTVADGIIPNGFDEWNDQLDQEAAKEAANQTPARMQGGGSAMDGGIGWSDLDNNGGWYPMPGYGMMWQPSGVGADFDPYGDGMWADMGGDFGYSWVSGYPWGWLPFHYGMWTYIGGFGWGWSPCGYPFGGGFGYGYGYGYGYRGWVGGRNHPRTNVYGGPVGYHAPTPPTVAKGVAAPRIVAVGRGVVPATAGLNASRSSQISGRNALRPITVARTKIEPLHSMAATNVPVRNAALFNNASPRVYQRSYSSSQNLRTSLAGRTTAGRGTLTGNRAPSFTTGRGASTARFSASANHATFGQHTSFGSHGSFGGAQSGYRSTGGLQSGSQGGGFRGGYSGGHAGGMSSGGFHGGNSGGRAGGMSSGGYNGGGGGFHGGGMSSGHTGR